MFQFLNLNFGKSLAPAEPHRLTSEKIINTHLSAGRFDDALDFACEVFTIQQKRYSKQPDHPAVIQALANMMQAQIAANDICSVSNAHVEQLERAVYQTKGRADHNHAHLAVILLEHLGYNKSVRGTEREARALSTVAALLSEIEVGKVFRAFATNVCFDACVNLSSEARFSKTIEECCNALAQNSPGRAAHYRSLTARQADKPELAIQILDDALKQIDQHITDGRESERTKFLLLESQMHAVYQLPVRDAVARSEVLLYRLMEQIKDKQEYRDIQANCRRHLLLIYNES